MGLLSWSKSHETSYARVGRSSSHMNEPDEGPDHEEHGHGAEWIELVRIAFVAIAAAAVWFHFGSRFRTSA